MSKMRKESEAAGAAQAKAWVQESTGYDSKRESLWLPATWEYFRRRKREHVAGKKIQALAGLQETLRPFKRGEQVAFKKTLIPKCAVNRV